jgi:predicted flavoprotein YhiN
LDQWDVIVVGGGPAGLMAACAAALRGRNTLLLEKNRTCGAKILLSGGTRCNLTHDCDRLGISTAFGPHGRFLRSALAALGPQEVVACFAEEGVATKIEPGGKVFPATDRAADVLAALLARLRRSGSATVCGEPLCELQRDGPRLRLVTPQRTLRAESVVLATGGMSYPSSGSSGDGYRWAAALGHTIVTPLPALVPVTTHADWVRRLQGITLPEIRLRVVQLQDASQGDSPVFVERKLGQSPAKCLAERHGALLFAHFGVTGPAALDVSRAVSRHPQPERLVLECDLAPGLKAEAVEAAIREKCSVAGKRLAAGILEAWVPQRLSATIAQLSGLAPDRHAAELSRTERRALVRGLKRLEIPVAGTMGFRKAEVTSGGVALEEVDSRTMQSKLEPGLFFAGEVLDLDGPIGGYNFQAAFSTGWLAGRSA